MLNLIINAEQAMLGANGRGTLIIRTWHDPQKDAVVLEVHDDGPGVPEDVQPRIFDPFFTTKDVGKGTGLGLTVAYAIVQEHSGRITVKSGRSAARPSTSSCRSASSSLKPRQREPVEPRRRSWARADRFWSWRTRRRSARRCPKRWPTPDSACRWRATGSKRSSGSKSSPYDLIVCDLKMPRLDGTAFYRQLEADHAALARRVLFVTGDVAGTEAERFLEETGCRWLPKPFRLKDLLRVAGEMLGLIPPSADRFVLARSALRRDRSAGGCETRLRDAAARLRDRLQRRLCTAAPRRGARRRRTSPSASASSSAGTRGSPDAALRRPPCSAQSAPSAFRRR